MQTFSNAVQEALGFYVYALVDPRDKKIFYIGKGKGNRVFQHLQCALEDNVQTLKLDTIRQIISEGKEVEYYILRHKLTEEQAFIVESTLIDLLTYDKFNIDNILTNIQSGHHQWDEGIKSADEISILYDCEKLQPNAGELLLLVSLNKSYNQKQANGVYKRTDIYEATRKYWPISASRLKDIKYVLGIYHGIVRSVYKPKQWFSTNVADDGTIFKHTRYGFDAVVDDNSRAKYLNKDASDYPFGSGGCIRYIKE